MSKIVNYLDEALVIIAFMALIVLDAAFALNIPKESIDSVFWVVMGYLGLGGLRESPFSGLIMTILDQVRGVAKAKIPVVQPKSPKAIESEDDVIVGEPVDG